VRRKKAETEEGELYRYVLISVSHISIQFYAIWALLETRCLGRGLDFGVRFGVVFFK